MMCVAVCSQCPVIHMFQAEKVLLALFDGRIAATLRFPFPTPMALWEPGIGNHCFPRPLPMALWELGIGNHCACLSTACHPSSETPPEAPSAHRPRPPLANARSEGQESARSCPQPQGAQRPSGASRPRRGRRARDLALRGARWHTAWLDGASTTPISATLFPRLSRRWHQNACTACHQKACLRSLRFTPFDVGRGRFEDGAHFRG